jgi:8-oxo-dGTP pyrophosphatase MutT (NUDIX family)
VTPREVASFVVEAGSIARRLVARRFGGPPTRGVMVVVTNDRDEVLLIKNTYRWKWSLPGGWVDPNESFLDAAAREVAEETGYEIDGPLELIAEYNGKRHSDQLFRGRAGRTVRAVATPWEISAVRWCTIEELPELSTPARRVLDLANRQ